MRSIISAFRRGICSIHRTGKGGASFASGSVSSPDASDTNFGPCFSTASVTLDLT